MKSIPAPPDIAFPRLLVWTTYRDVAPAEIEEFVTIPVEEAVAMGLEERESEEFNCSKQCKHIYCS